MKKPAQILLCLLVFLFGLTTCAYSDIATVPSENKRKEPPVPAIESIRLVPLPDRPNHIAVAVQLKSSPLYSRVVQMELEKTDKTAYDCPTFEPKPFVMVEKKELESIDPWEKDQI